MNHRRTIQVLAVLVLVPMAATSCGIDKHASSNHDRFSGAQGIEVPSNASEAAWWQDPTVSTTTDPEELETQIIEASVPADALYATGDAALSPESERALERVFAGLDPNAISGVDIDCHADTTGTADGNQALSELRATGVATWISAHGYASSAQLTASGHGDTQPIDTNDTPTGRARNRRCTLTIDTAEVVEASDAG